MDLTDSDTRPPSTTGSFLRGFFGGASNSAMILGLFSAAYGAFSYGIAAAGLAAAPASLAVAFLPISLAMGGAMMVATGLFSGIMSVRRANEEQAAAERVSKEILREAEMSVRALQPSLDPEIAPEEVTTSRWQDRTARGMSASARLQAILDQGQKSKQDHAENILREREQAPNTDVQR